MYYVVRKGKELAVGSMLGFDTFGAAKKFAEHRHNHSKYHYQIMEVKAVWTTETTAEAMAEGES